LAHSTLKIKWSYPNPLRVAIAFVNYYRKEDAAKAIATLNGFGYDHLILSVEWAKPAQER
jgi:hypothetical protein